MEIIEKGAQVIGVFSIFGGIWWSVPIVLKLCNKNIACLIQFTQQRFKKL